MQKSSPNSARIGRVPLHPNTMRGVITVVQKGSLPPQNSPPRPPRGSGCASCQPLGPPGCPAAPRKLPIPALPRALGVALPPDQTCSCPRLLRPWPLRCKHRARTHREMSQPRRRVPLLGVCGQGLFCLAPCTARGAGFAVMRVGQLDGRHALPYLTSSDNGKAIEYATCNAMKG